MSLKKPRSNSRSSVLAHASSTCLPLRPPILLARRTLSCEAPDHAVGEAPRPGEQRDLEGLALAHEPGE